MNKYFRTRLNGPNNCWTGIDVPLLIFTASPHVLQTKTNPWLLAALRALI